MGEGELRWEVVEALKWKLGSLLITEIGLIFTEKWLRSNCSHVLGFVLPEVFLGINKSV